MPPRRSLGKQVLCIVSLISIFSVILFAEIFEISIPAFVIFLVTIFILGGTKNV